MSQNTANDILYCKILGRARKLFDPKGTTDFIKDLVLSPVEFLHSGSLQSNGDYGATSLRSFLTEQGFAAAMASKDICIFGSHPNKVLWEISFYIRLNVI
jgi:hypothetical protein